MIINILKPNRLQATQRFAFLMSSRPDIYQNNIQLYSLFFFFLSYTPFYDTGDSYNTNGDAENTASSSGGTNFG